MAARAADDAELVSLRYWLLAATGAAREKLA
jgi:hypothetical protein